MSKSSEELNSSKLFLKGAAILSLSMIAVKLCGIVYKVALPNLYGTLGDKYASIGSGIFGNTYELYAVLFTLATAGFPIAVSRLISESTAKGRYKDVKQIHSVSKPFFLFTGFIFFLLMFFGSYWYVDSINSPYSLYPIMCLAPLTFFGCLVAIYRGYFEGLRNMKPTAISEIIEAITKLVVGLSLSYAVTTIGLNQYKADKTIFGFTFETEGEAFNTLISFSVTAAIAGITLGSLFCLIYLYIRYKVSDDIPQEYIENSVEAKTKKETFMRLLKTAIPIGLASLVMSIAGFIDQAVIQNVIFNMAVNNPKELLAQFDGLMDDQILFDSAGNILRDKSGDISKDAVTIHTALWGCYGNALTIIQVITTAAQVFGTSAMPNVTSAYTRGNKGELKSAIEIVLKLTTLIVFPAGIGVFVLAEPIMHLVYSSVAISTIGADVLRVLGLSIIFVAFSTPLCSMLQGIGRVDMPLKLFTVGMIIKLLLNYCFVSVMEINIVGAAIGSLVAYIIVCAAAMYQLVKNSGIIPDFMNTIVKQFLGAVICGVTAYLSYNIIGEFISFKIAVILSIAIAMVFYLISLILLRSFTANELKMLPKGEKFAKMLAKWNLIR